MIWRPVNAKKATLQEIETHYSILDLYRLNVILDAVEDAEIRASKKAAAKS